MRGLLMALLAMAIVWLAPRLAEAGRKHECLRRLDRLGVRYQRVRRRGIRVAVRVKGGIAGVRYRGYRRGALVLDCSLVYSLARTARTWRDAGVQSVVYSSAYQIRKVKGTGRPSQHSYGLAIDVHVFETQSLGPLAVKEVFEKQLGDDDNCLGSPETPGGTVLKTFDCQMRQSGLFRFVLTPDTDAGHFNHFHIEALPWDSRDDVRRRRM